MKRIIYNKLVRDGLPKIFEKEGKTCFVETLTDEMYIKTLNEQLVEELNAYLKNGTVEELAEMGETMHAILAYKNVPLEEFQRVRLEKLETFGGYKDRVFLKTVEEK